MTSDEQKACDEACATHIHRVMDFDVHSFNNSMVESAIKNAFEEGWKAKAGYKPRFHERQVWKCEACTARTLASTEADARSNLIEFSKRQVGRASPADPFSDVTVANCKHFTVVPTGQPS